MGLIRTGAGDCDGDCEFLEVQVGRDDASDLIPAATKVLLPCAVCGTRPLDVLAFYDSKLAANEQAFARHLAEKFLPLFHWSPRSRRAQILRYGLRPRMRPTTHAGDGSQTWRAGYVCFADTPSWAWDLSGGQRSAPAGEWDLWSTNISRLPHPFVLPADWANGIHEVRTDQRVFKRDLWHVATRTKP